ncbi:MAG TPA: hypothetical protein VMV10_16965 [Pirellulales bacterium]|nr:hypothetical protein [Pirellulales bacterium]
MTFAHLSSPRATSPLTFACLLSAFLAAARAPAKENGAGEKRESREQTKLVRQAADGTVSLHARVAAIHGTTVRYEPQPNKNTIGYWTKVEDWVSWDFEIAKPGRFKVEILQGCGKGSGGSEVDFSVGEQTLEVTVKDTGGFQNFENREIGELKLEAPGRYTLKVKPKKKPGVAVMDLREVKLSPVKR